jgi:nucleotide-binding universal stress UspA family protein
MTPSPETIAATDRAQHDHAADIAAQGAELARSLGAEAEPYPVADDVDAAETIAAEAERLDAAVIVIGSRGLGRMKSRLLGSTSQGLLRHTRRPVIVVRAPD